MLPSDLLIHRYSGETVVPKRLVINSANIEIAADLIHQFQEAKGGTRGELNRQLLELEGEDTDYRIKRGLAHLLNADAFSTFETVSPLDPATLRQRIFAIAAQASCSAIATTNTLQCLADALT